MAKPTFTIQWHLTTNCHNNCKHCYMERNSNMFSLFDCKTIINDIKTFVDLLNCNIRIDFTGGDPLLYPHFFELMEYICFWIPNVKIGVLGNPELLTKNIIKRLKEIPISFYQLSLDGFKDTHDKIRYSGSFDIILEKVGILKKNNIKTVIMSTVSKLNLAEIPSLVDLIVDLGVDLFGFHRFIPMGDGDKIKDLSQISASDYRNFLCEMYNQYDKYKHRNTVFAKGEPLMVLLEQEKGIFQYPKVNENNLIWSGCSIGCSSLCILEEGGEFYG